MRNKKIATILTVAVLWLAAPLFAIPNANAFHSSITVDITGTQNYSSVYADPMFGSVESAREGSSVVFNVKILANSNAGQRNVTVGVKFDWMTSYQNATNARPNSTLILTQNQYVIVTLSVTMPTVSGQYVGYNLYLHTWRLRIWSAAANSPIGPTADTCPTHTPDSQRPNVGCFEVTQSNFALYSADQADGMASRAQAYAKWATLSGTFSSLTELPPGASKAAADISQASAEISLGDTNYSSGDFAGAKTHYTSALNLANSAAAALSGGDSAGYTNVLLGGIGWLLGGVGVLLGGIGAFWYFMKRPKASMMMPKP